MTNKRDFNLGDCVTVCGADSHYEGYTGEVVEVYELISDIYNYLVNFEDDVSCWYFANELKLVDRISYEKSASPEQNALEFLLKQDDTIVHIFFKDEISDWVREFMSQKDYKNARQAIELLENLEKERVQE